jgi:hypothetical protein
MTTEQRVRADARHFVNSFMCPNTSDRPNGISAEWLMSMHPELKPEDAEAYRSFCQGSTIVYRECYGDGSIMWPRWMAFKSEVDTL